MINKEEAIALLDQYLELEYNIDPINKDSPKLKAHRLNIAENDYCWIIPMCPANEVKKDHSYAGLVGSGPYFIDKETKEIYGTGGATHIQYEEDFIYFKEKGISLLDWIPLKSNYLNAEMESRIQTEIPFFTLKAKYETRASEMQGFLLEQQQQETKLENLVLRYKPIDGIDCLVIIHKKHELSSEIPVTKKNVRLKYTGGFKAFPKVLMDLKKWVRVNHKKGTDNYWIEILETDRSKDFNQWILSAHLEFI